LPQPLVFGIQVIAFEIDDRSGRGWRGHCMQRKCRPTLLTFKSCVGGKVAHYLSEAQETIETCRALNVCRREAYLVEIHCGALQT
jgi:hypothetical protein